ncbi:MAG TPA: thioredoxin [Acidiferrobacterales bacterium]|nr:thioredoxin [Acidiferrobacterales bacterium]
MNPSPHIADVTQQTFESLVLAKSREIPVLADFWAAWCGPCKQLMPVLARLADEYDGRFFLAKINSDTEQPLAARYGVKSLPTVKLFRNGQVVEEFMGAQPEKTIRALLDRHIPRASDTLVYNAMLAARSGKPDEALTILQQAATTDPTNDRAKLELARLHAYLGHADDAEIALASLSAEAKESTDAVGLKAQLEFARIVAGARPPDELLPAIAANARDSAARYELAAHLVLRQQHEAALDQLLEIVRTDRKFRDDAGRKAMLSIFNLLGGSGDIVKQYRTKLSMALN